MHVIYEVSYPEGDRAVFASPTIREALAAVESAKQDGATFSSVDIWRWPAGHEVLEARTWRLIRIPEDQHVRTILFD